MTFDIMKSLEGGPVPKLIEQADKALDALVEAMSEVAYNETVEYDRGSERWKDSERGQAYYVELQRLQSSVDNLEEVRLKIRSYID